VEREPCGRPCSYRPQGEGEGAGVVRGRASCRSLSQRPAAHEAASHPTSHARHGDNQAGNHPGQTNPPSLTVPRRADTFSDASRPGRRTTGRARPRPSRARSASPARSAPRPSTSKSPKARATRSRRRVRSARPTTRPASRSPCAAYGNDARDPRATGRRRSASARPYFHRCLCPTPLIMNAAGPFHRALSTSSRSPSNTVPPPRDSFSHLGRWCGLRSPVQDEAAAQTLRRDLLRAVGVQVWDPDT
jgi:hypothetical protein